jgi:hypothetical protein
MASKRISKELQVRLQAPLRAGREAANQPALFPVPSQPGPPPRDGPAAARQSAEPGSSALSSDQLLTTRAVDKRLCRGSSPAS